jgi:hypothetical protein
LIAQLALNPLPQLTVHNRLVLAGVAFFAVPNLADVDRVGKQLIERAARECLPSRAVAVPGEPNLGDDAPPVELSTA